MTEEETKIITREKHPGRVPQGHKFAALMKKRKEKILHNKRTVRQSKYSSQCSLQYSSQYSLQYSIRYSLQYSSHYSLQHSQMILLPMTLVYLPYLPLVVVYFLRITLSLKIKSKPMKEKDQKPKRHPML